jgi:SAM-dependent methyltransferase
MKDEQVQIAAHVAHRIFNRCSIERSWRRAMNLAIRQPLWNLVQNVLGCPDFKSKLYRSVLRPPGRLLDFGCANGHIAEVFLEFDYHGIDIDPSAIDAARKRFKGHPNAKFIAADIHSRPYEPDYFDEILLAGTAHHLTDDLFVSVLRELNYCLKPGKVIHLLDPVLQEKDGWQAKFLRHFDRGRYPRHLDEFMTLIDSLKAFEVGEPTLHTPYGAPIQECDFVYLPLRKRG